jgi:hypothetical protein
VGMRRKLSTIPAAVYSLGLAAIITYLAARTFAFRLYVPDRHLQSPLAFFLICGFTIGAWRAFRPRNVSDDALPVTKPSSWQIVAFATIAMLIWSGSRSGLQNSAEFNTWRYKRGGMFEWIRQTTPESAIIASHPTLIDGVQLFGMRKGYVTSETTHPFYLGYYNEMERRIRLALTAYYTRDLAQLVAFMRDEQIDYFAFRHTDFSKKSLASATYYRPFDLLVKELTQTDEATGQYVYHQLRDRRRAGIPSGVRFNDAYALIVEREALAQIVSGESSGEP